jgi:RNA polymerase sigma-70 factor (ECF subfamily)
MLRQVSDPADILLRLREAPKLTAQDIVHQHAGRIRNVARRLLANEVDVEDVTQEVLLRVVRKLDTFRGESEVSTWLYRVTVNCALLHRRKQALKRTREVGMSLQELENSGRPASPVSPWGAPDRHLMGRELNDCIERAIRGLPEPYRVTFVLSVIEGMPNADVAKLLGLSRGAVKSRVHRARLMLRDVLRPHFEEARRQDS